MGGDVVDYLNRYANRFDLPIRLNTSVTKLTRTAAGAYLAQTDGEAVRARQVVVATGPFQIPVVPTVSGELDPRVTQMHSKDYRNASMLPAGRVLVVGAGNSGCQIAKELSATHDVELSVGDPNPVLPQRPFGRDIWWWASGLRLDRVTAQSRLGGRLAGGDDIGPAVCGPSLRFGSAAVCGPGAAAASGRR